MFNDSEVRRFDAVNNQTSECFGGNDANSADLTTGLVHHHHQHDKSNSAYMLFYERRRSPTLPTPPTSTTSTTTAMSTLDNNDPALFRAILAENVRKCRPAAAWLIAHSHSASSSASSWSHKFLVKCPIGALRLIMQRLLALAIVRLLSVSDDDADTEAEAGIDGPQIVGAFVRISATSC